MAGSTSTHRCRLEDFTQHGHQAGFLLRPTIQLFICMVVCCYTLPQAWELKLASSVSVGQSVTARFPHTASTWSHGKNIFLVIRWLGRKQLWDWRTQLLPGCTSRTAHTGPEGRLHFSTTVLQIQSHKCSSLLLLQVSPFSSFLSSPHLMSSLISNLLCN